jgi:hypothetical protein
MSESELPQDPPDWEVRDREFALARKVRIEKAEAWRKAGGYWPVGGNPSHPKEWAEVVAADEAYYEMSREAMPPPFTELRYGITSLNPLLDGIADGNASSIEDAISWLEDDPFARWTGYVKQKIMNRLCGASLSVSHEDRLRSVLLRLTTRGPRQEFPNACKLARHVDSAEFRSRLRILAQRPEVHISYAAGRMLAACETKGKRKGAR